MDKRRYVQRARAETAQATRERILDAALATFDRGLLAAVRIDDVARRAGTSRSTVYHLFGDRSGLLVALANRLRDRRVGSQRPPRAPTPGRPSGAPSASRSDVRPALTARALFTLAAVDPDAVAAVGRRSRRRPGMVAPLGGPRPRPAASGVTAREAADLLDRDQLPGIDEC
jgi:AcrR family transcriptional regulator